MIDWEKVLKTNVSKKKDVALEKKTDVTQEKQINISDNSSVTKEKSINVASTVVSNSINNNNSLHQEEKITSNNIKDQVKIKCKICMKAIVMFHFQGHTKNVHFMSLEQYVTFYGDWKSTVVVPIFHKCKLSNCSDYFLVDPSELAIHLKSSKHLEEGMKPKEYIKKYLSEKTVPINQSVKKASNKKSPAKNIVKKKENIPAVEVPKDQSTSKESQIIVEPIKEPPTPESVAIKNGTRQPLGEISANIPTCKQVNVSMKKLNPQELVRSQQVEVFESNTLKVSKTVIDTDVQLKSTKMKITESLKRKIEEESNEIEGIHKKIKEKQSLSAEELLKAIDSLLDWTSFVLFFYTVFPI